MWLPLGLSLAESRWDPQVAGQSALIGPDWKETGRAANQTGRIRPERMGDWICKAGGVGNLECYARKKDDDDGHQSAEREGWRAG